jgi:hypothetical protein
MIILLRQDGVKINEHTRKLDAIAFEVEYLEMFDWGAQFLLKDGEVHNTINSTKEGNWIINGIDEEFGYLFIYPDKTTIPEHLIIKLNIYPQIA